MPRGTIPLALPPFQGWVRRLVVASTAIFLLQKILEAFSRVYEANFVAYAGLVPALVIHGGIWQLVSYSFLHQTFWHLLGNMLGLWMIGSLEEMEWGSPRFLELYFLSVIGGALTTIAAAYLHIFGVSTTVPTIGASAGILGMLMALAVIDGDREFTVLLFFVLPLTLKVKYLVAIITLGVLVATIGASTGSVANVAHVGGLLCGFLWAKFIPRRGLAFEASESYYGIHNAYHRWKRRQAAKKFEVYMRKSEREIPRFDEKGNYIPPDDDPPRKPNGDSGSGSKWVN